MSSWQITQPPPAPQPPRKPGRPAARQRRCNCGRPAVAKARVQVGLDGCYTVTLYLCARCLAYEQSACDVPPPLSITPL